MTTIVAVIIAAILGPLLLSMLNNRQALAREQRANDRQDQVAEKAAETAGLLLAAQEQTTSEGAAIGKKLGVIHDLVNSNVTALKQAELDGAKRELVMMQRLIDLDKAKIPNADDAAMLLTTRNKILDLESELDARRTQQEMIDAAGQGDDP